MQLQASDHHYEIIKAQDGNDYVSLWDSKHKKYVWRRLIPNL
jgi:hypothetical protein